jgi:type II secretory pathway pseudopilin PulG
MTLVELVVVTSAAALMMVATAAYSLPYMQKQTMRSATYTVQHNLQLARIEAIARNHEVRFVIDNTTNEVTILDSMGTPGDTTDDEVLYQDELSNAVIFARPDGGDAVTLDPLGSGTEFQAVFEADGSVPADSIGEIYLHGGDDFGMIAVYGAGGVEVEMWGGSTWTGGSSSGGGSSSIPDGPGTGTGTDPILVDGSGVDVIPYYENVR